MEAPDHEAFVAAYREGRIRVTVDRARAADFISGRLMLPFAILPLYGAAVAVALLGHLYVGAAMFLATLLFRYLVRASGRGFVLSHALGDAGFFSQATAARLIKIERTES